MMRPSAIQPSCSRLLRSFLDIESSSWASSTLPLYLCPAAARPPSTLSNRSSRRPIPEPQEARLLPLRQVRQSHAQAAETTDIVPFSQADASVDPPVPVAEPAPVRPLPVQCHGCGALSQTTVPDIAGYYDLHRKPVQIFLGLFKQESRRRSDNDMVQASLRRLSAGQLQKLGIDPDALAPQTPQNGKEHSTKAPPEVPLCDRCHKLVYHHTGTPILHPTIEAIRDTLAESPYKYNHVYHVLDAADFPLSLLPRVHKLLDLMPLRSRNRRQRSGMGKFFKGKRTEMSFIITRADLLAPKKEAVDRMMPYLVETLRDALPRGSRHVRLGNVRCVSAKRSWWTKELKEDIWRRGGAGWMVGRVNVGKSQLFHEVFPKGRMGWKESKHAISVAMQHKDHENDQEAPSSVLQELDELDEDGLLPPAQKEKMYPQMPIVSALPGTTASPIRVPFGGGKGELIDLPGLARSDLENLIREEHRPSLVMKARITPEQHVIKPGRSLLIGGFIRITPRTPDLIFLGYNFTPLEEHMCGTDNAIAIQTQTGGANVENMALPETAATIKLAGSFPLKYDVTKRRAGPITRKDSVGMKVEQLPYRVLSIDILIEGCGWVEITAQVRARELYKPLPKPAASTDADGEETLESMDLSEFPMSNGTRPKRFRSDGEDILQSLDLSNPGARPKPSPRDRSRDRRGPEPEPRKAEDEELNWPVVDVYSPEGRFVGSRRPMNAWLYNKVRKTPQTSKQRPRKSMSGAKKWAKRAKRAYTSSGGFAYERTTSSKRTHNLGLPAFATPLHPPSSSAQHISSAIALGVDPRTHLLPVPTDHPNVQLAYLSSAAPQSALNEAGWRSPHSTDNGCTSTTCCRRRLRRRRRRQQQQQQHRRAGDADGRSPHRLAHTHTDNSAAAGPDPDADGRTRPGPRAARAVGRERGGQRGHGQEVVESLLHLPRPQGRRRVERRVRLVELELVVLVIGLGQLGLGRERGPRGRGSRGQGEEQWPCARAAAAAAGGRREEDADAEPECVREGAEAEAEGRGWCWCWCWCWCWAPGMRMRGLGRVGMAFIGYGPALGGTATCCPVRRTLAEQQGHVPCVEGGQRRSVRQEDCKDRQRSVVCCWSRHLLPGRCNRQAVVRNACSMAPKRLRRA